MIKITILIDNLPNPSLEDLQAEHALSLLVESDHATILCDMGASAAFATNAARLGIDLSNLDFALLSHGHADHSGGLEAFLKMNDSCPVILSPNVFIHRYYSSRRGAKRDISTDHSLYPRYEHRFHATSHSRWMTSDIAVICNQEHSSPKPRGNAFLTMEDSSGEHLDDFAHELSLAIRSNEGLVVLSSCSHAGALNIIKSCQRFTKEERVAAFVGGLHFVDGVHAEAETQVFIEQWRREYPEMRVFSGHCTGSTARALLSKEQHFHLFHTGADITLH